MSIFLDALKNKNSAPIPPVWLMRQAGRYMASYQRMREKYSFESLCKEPELAYKVTKLPIDQFDFDAAIIFSDILYIASLFGCEVAFKEGEGPVISPAIEPHHIDTLVKGSVEETLGFVPKAIELWKGSEVKPIIGFAGAPFTVACYMIEGSMGTKKSNSFQKTKRFFYEEPERFHKLLDALTDATIEYLNAQIDAGCDAIQLFDSWANILSWDDYQMYASRYLDRLFRSLRSCPRIYFSRGASSFYESIQTLPIDAISLDAQCSVSHIRKKVSLTLQGNLDPDLLLADGKTVARKVRSMVDEMGRDPGYIFNLGHGVLPGTPEKNVALLVEEVRRASNG